MQSAHSWWYSPCFLFFFFISQKINPIIDKMQIIFFYYAFLVNQLHKFLLNIFLCIAWEKYHSINSNIILFKEYFIKLQCSIIE